jgi:hypothetical protein
MVEREMKRIATGRKNYLFVCSDQGGKTAAILYSFTSTCARPRARSLRVSSRRAGPLARSSTRAPRRADARALGGGASGITVLHQLIVIAFVPPQRRTSAPAPAPTVLHRTLTCGCCSDREPRAAHGLLRERGRTSCVRIAGTRGGRQTIRDGVRRDEVRRLTSAPTAPATRLLTRASPSFVFENSIILPRNSIQSASLELRAPGPER